MGPVGAGVGTVEAFSSSVLVGPTAQGGLPGLSTGTWVPSSSSDSPMRVHEKPFYSMKLVFPQSKFSVLSDEGKQDARHTLDIHSMKKSNFQF